MLEQFGPYQVVKQLGRGGMGAVLEGVHESTGERRAIKVLADWFADDEDFRQRFRSEIEALKQLDHENIVRLTGFGEQEGHLFYTMELVDGPNLQEVAQQGHTFTWQEVVKIAVQVSAALKHAHDRGIIHRDLKPANLMWSEDGQGPIKLTDFGIAKLFGSSQMTMAGGVIGTADFMSPEQASARPVTHRSDLYSLGSVMYSLLTKRPPFRGPSKTQLLDDLINQPPLPLGRLVFGIPDELESIVSQLLAKKPEDRIASALILSRRLQSLMHAHDRGVLGGEEVDVNDGEFDVHVELSDHTNGVDQTRVSPPTAPLSDPRKTKLTDRTSAKTSARRTNVSSENAIGDLSETVISSQTGSTEVDVPSAATTSFTEVAEPADKRVVVADVDTAKDEDGSWASTAMLLAGLAIVIAVAWWLSRPQPAEQIYATIESVAAQGDHSKWVDVRDKMDEFLRIYPDHQLAANVSGWREDHEWYKLWRKFERQSNKEGGDEFLTPCQQAFLAASRLDNADQREQAISAYQQVAASCGDDGEEERLLRSLTEHRLNALTAQPSGAPND